MSTVPGVIEVAVVGVDDEEWGQRVAAVVHFEEGKGMELKEFREALKKELAPYKIPSLLKVVEGIERNAMGKINKKELVGKLWPKESGESK